LPEIVSIQMTPPPMAQDVVEDLLTLDQEENKGHALFIVGAGYLTFWLCLYRGCS